MTAKPKATPEARTDAGEGGWSLDDFLGDFQPVEQVVHLTVRGDLLGRHSDLSTKLDGARQLAGDGIDDGAYVNELAEQLLDIEAELERSLRAFTVRAVGDKVWSDLIAAHPPTDAEKKDNRFAAWHPETFWPAAIAASVVQPSVTPAAAVKMHAAIDSGQMQKLRDAVVAVNGGGADIPKSAAAFVLRRNSKPNSTTPSI